MPHDRIFRRPLEEGERVSVHMNLNNGLLTVKSREGDMYDRVIQHRSDPLLLSGVEFRVQDSVLQKIREHEQRAVCAYAVGRVTFETVDQVGDPIRFNPFEHDTFFFADGEEPIEEADYLRTWIEETDEGRRPHMQAITDEHKVPEKAHAGTH